MKKFYLTTAIDYVNAKVHLGHSLEKVYADVLARYYRLKGRKVFFLTGTDENAQKNVLAAEEEKISPKKFVDQNANFAKKLWKKLNISFDFFIRTTDKKIHWPGVEKLWKECKKAGDIYKKEYTGYYCLGCEAFLKERDLKNGLCPFHLKKPEKITEKNYFFRLSRYQEKLKKIIKNKIKIFPKERENEILQFIEMGLEDFSISRPKERMRNWGIPVPDDKTQTIYVWFDALANYLTGIGYGRDEKKFKTFWPADLHIIGKDIWKFHAIYWPAILLSAKLGLPKAILVHGFITVSGQKMSKSLGNIVQPSEIIEKYGADALRYFLLKESSPFEDLDFTFEKFEQKYNSDLAKGLGNLVSRVLSLAKKLKIEKIKLNDPLMKEKVEETKKEWEKEIEKFEFHLALKSIWDLISFCDKYIQEKKVWEKSKEQAKFLSNLLFSLEEIAQLLSPFLPETSTKILQKIKKKDPSPLFPKV